MDEAYWIQKYEQVQAPQVNPVVVGFNVNLDRIIPVSRTLLDSAGFGKRDLAGLRARLMEAMAHCTAEEWFVANPGQYARFTEFFSKTGTLAMGGQAGIAALHLAGLGAPAVFCLAPSIGPEAACILKNCGVQVPGHDTDTATCPDTVHLIFEYQPGLVPLATDAVPRNNRFIASPRKTAANTLLDADLLASVLPQITGCTRAFLSGYQYLGGEDEFERAADQIRALKNSNPQMRVHIECVTVSDEMILAGLLHHILPVADSAGMNEHELSLLPGQAGDQSPAGLVQGMLDLARQTGLARIHLHTFGYYLLVMQKNGAEPEASLAALLFAARVVAGAARGSSTEISPRGIDAVRQIARVYGQGPAPGIFTAGDYFVLAIPTRIVSDVKKTTGLGDILSSTAFVADRMNSRKSA